MLEAIREFLGSLGGTTERHFNEDDTRLAAAAVLVHAMLVDGHVSPDEEAKLREVLARDYHLSGEDLDTLIRDATAAEDESIDLYRFTSVLKRHLSAEAKRQVIAQLWEIVYADGISHEFEENLVWRVAELLGVPREERLALRTDIALSKP